MKYVKEKLCFPSCNSAANIAVCCLHHIAVEYLLNDTVCSCEMLLVKPAGFCLWALLILHNDMKRYCFLYLGRLIVPVHTSITTGCSPPRGEEQSACREPDFDGTFKSI